MAKLPIEIKVNVGGDVDDALARLGKLPGPKRRQVWFVEDRDGLSRGALTLLSRGVILRARCGVDKADSTAKLRPIDSMNLIGEWARPVHEDGRFEYGIEGDWSGDRRVTAASAGFRHRGDELAHAVDAADFASIFSGKQRRLIRDCAHVDIGAAELQLLGPIACVKWEELDIGRVEKVNAERWTAAHLDFLELAIRVEPDDDESRAEYLRRAARAQRDLLDAVAAVGLSLDDSTESKTQRVLAELAGMKEGCAHGS